MELTCCNYGTVLFVIPQILHLDIKVDKRKSDLAKRFSLKSPKITLRKTLFLVFPKKTKKYVFHNIPINRKHGITYC